MSEQELNKLCAGCANACKQNAAARIVECPRFVRLPDEQEFRRMVDDLTSIEDQARTLQKRARDLIQGAVDKPEDQIPHS